MSFTTAISTCFRKYATFSGRARRSEFWFFWLFCTIVTTVLSLIFGDSALIPTLFSLATLIPSWSAAWRRMHDIGKCGAWSLIIFVPIVGIILWLIWFCRDSQAGSNTYGPNPKMQ